MKVNYMKSHVNRQFLREIEKAFSARYPYLKIEFAQGGMRWPGVGEGGIDGDRWQPQAADLLVNEVGMTDEMSVAEFEARVLQVLGAQGVVLRKSGNFWIETSMTQKWSLRDQNDHGEELASGAQ